MTTTGLVPRRWVKARRSDNAASCVEVMVDAGTYHLRDSKDGGHGPVLECSTTDWQRLCAAVRAGHSVQVADLRVELPVDGHLTIRRLGDGATLRYTPLELECFLDGLRGGEFEPQRPAVSAG